MFAQPLLSHSTLAGTLCAILREILIRLETSEAQIDGWPLVECSCRLLETNAFERARVVTTAQHAHLQQHVHQEHKQTGKNELLLIARCLARFSTQRDRRVVYLQEQVPLYDVP